MKYELHAALCALMAAATLLTVCCSAPDEKSIPDAPAPDQVTAILRQNDCFVCHSSKPERLLKHSARHAARFTDLEANAGEWDDDVAISMIDHAVTYRTMPPRGYRLLHKGKGFNSEEIDFLSGWLEAVRGFEGIVSPVPDHQYDEVNEEIADLGRRMFNDTRLSLDGSISCATCHILESGGADHADERVSEGINGLKGNVNSPTVYNAKFNIKQFWNGRAGDLREQAAEPATNPVEMGDQTWDDICRRLSKDQALVEEFEALFPGEGLTMMTVTSAIAEFESTLTTPDSPFDQYLNGDPDAISEDELRGFEKFKKYACATCHTGINLGGRSFEYVDVFGNYFKDRSKDIEYNSDDDGLKSVTGNDEDLHKFRVPGLRNVALTAPYFHDGSFQTLEEAVKAMAKYELGRKLSDEDVRDIITFMNTLTGKSPYLQ